jgi:tetrapyrrole methylase family protein/MazG family protein
VLRGRLLWRWRLKVTFHGGPADLYALAAILEDLPADLVPTNGLQVMDAQGAFEPNPTVATVVSLDVNDTLGRQRIGAALRRSLAADQPVWLLECGKKPVETTLSAIEQARPAICALFVPAIEAEAAERSLAGLRQIVHRLRAPGGCPWDRNQTHESLAKYTIEEAYEVVDAIRHHGPNELAEELGDLLLQVFLQSELAEEAGDFTLNDVVERLSGKLIHRHPHVFGDVQVGGAEDVEVNWEALKKAEKGERASVLDGIPKSLPALAMAAEMQKRLRKAGFEWPDRTGVEATLAEELQELRSANSADEAGAELGDVLWMATALGGWLGADAEDRLRATIHKVDARFRYVEDRVRERGQQVKDLSLDQMLALWDQAKSLDRTPGTGAP